MLQKQNNDVKDFGGAVMRIPQWIKESNLIEGVFSSLEDRRSYMAWLWLKKQETVTLDVLLKLHKKIMRVHLGKEAGHLRVCNVRVGNRTCPHYENVPGLVSDWLSHDLKKKSFDDILEYNIKQSHIRFEKIHPFIDGNGRTGRMIMNWQRVKNGLEPLCIRLAEVFEYYEWFE